MKKYFKLNGEWAVYIKNNKNYVLTESGRVWLVKQNRYAVYNQDNYYTMALYENAKQKQYYVHRLVAEHFLKPVEGANIVDHIDNNIHNNNRNNLRWVDSNGNAKNVYYKKSDMGVIRSVRNNQYKVFLGAYATKEEANNVYKAALEAIDNVL